MINTFRELYSLQKLYVQKIVANISEEDLYAGQENGVNSPGWILGHLIVEVEDIIKYLKLELEPIAVNWIDTFKGGENWEGRSLKELPSKELLIRVFTDRYDFLMNAYLELDDAVRKEEHPSKLFSGIYSNIDAWFAHHLITHLAIHAGNITVWKQIRGIQVEGF
ncbi:DinB family protein [Wenyingzhuangia sp. IMCC45574]